MTLKVPAGGKPNLALILGGTGVSLEQLVGAYVALNREGLAGSVKYTPDRVAGERRLLSPGAAWIIRDILEHHAQDGLREDTFDTGNRSRVAWKTGTSYGFRDAWALGSTAQYTVGVWVGRPDGTPMPGQYGAVTALPLMFQVINSLPRNGSVVADKVPADVHAEKICWPLGLPIDPAHPELCRQQRDAWTLNHSLPPTFPERDVQRWSAGRLDVQVDAASGERLSTHCLRAHTGRDVAIARWPSLAYPWLSQS
jgi:penicillin-binding protein 1C